MPSSGPFARLRPGARLEEDVHIGNFVEVKNARIEKGAKANHLTYLGDARVGAGANIGAGTITCNYDGFDKHHTDIGAGAFIGSNSALVAPVKIGDGAYVGAGQHDHEARRRERAGRRARRAEKRSRAGRRNSAPGRKRKKRRKPKSRFETRRHREHGEDSRDGVTDMSARFARLEEFRSASRCSNVIASVISVPPC